MKVLQILPELNSGGVERGTLELARYLVNQGDDSWVLSNGGHLVSSLEQEGTTHVSLPVHKKSLQSLRHVPSLRALLEKERFDIVHLRSRLPAWLVFLALRKIPPQKKPRVVTTVHGLYSVSRYSEVMTKGEKVICVSEATKNYVLENYPRVKKERLTVIPRGIEPDDYHHGYRPTQSWIENFETDFPDTRGKTLVTLPGRITRLKGHHEFFEIVSKLPTNFHGLVAGGHDPKKESYYQELQNSLRSRNLTDRISFLGHRSDLRDVLAHSHLVYSLSTKPESFGRTTLEALSLGTPVVGYDHGGVGEILATCFSQGICPLKDTSTAIQLTQEILTQKKLIKAPGQFTLKHMLDGTYQAYQKLLSEKLPSSP